MPVRSSSKHASILGNRSRSLTGIHVRTFAVQCLVLTCDQFSTGFFVHCVWTCGSFGLGARCSFGGYNRVSVAFDKATYVASSPIEAKPARLCEHLLLLYCCSWW